MLEGLYCATELGEIKEILQVIAQSTQARTSAAEAVKNAVEDRKTITTAWSKPDHKTQSTSHKKKRLKLSESGHGVFEVSLLSGWGLHERLERDS